jgi:hypothetical protein
LFARVRGVIAGDHMTYEYKLVTGHHAGKLTCVLSFPVYTVRDGKCKSIVVHNGRKMILMGGRWNATRVTAYYPIAWLICDGTELGLSLPRASLRLMESCVIQNDEHMARFLCIFEDADWKRLYYILSIPSESEGTSHHYSWQPCVAPVDKKDPVDFLV